ncbi:putative membrane-anchored protein [Chitinophaga skermanii]|uniref:Putative membrane-anchored protein n=1 Tax=Chitinophaga skermanii TaxID=331697 RepID=A0A327QJR6_9BACT|nr:DUF2167 domain-containing protein [Chitinophaga skermanii]RAJ03912.1 putative membrane-anchored protein [Chitinophaga skermanii]
MFRRIYLTIALLVASTALFASSKDSVTLTPEEQQFVDSIQKTFTFQNGVIALENNKIELNVPKGFVFLDAKQSKRLLVDLWGNPPASAEGVLGMIMREGTGAFDDHKYVFTISYEHDGHVKDDDAAKIDYDDLLKQMKESTKENNEARVKEGYPTIELIGWAQKPYYDHDKKILHWAKELKFGAEERSHTLNYDVRVLGREGVLSLTAIGTMDELKTINEDIPHILDIAYFTKENTYADFDPKVDQVAAWTIGGLIAGKVLAKAGFFALIMKFLIAGWKFIALGFIALFAAIRRIFQRKKEQAYSTPSSEEETVSEPAAIEAPGEATVAEETPSASSTTEDEQPKA